MIWKELTSSQQLDKIIADSHTIPALIFKHSTTCNISGVAKMRLEDEWEEIDQLPVVYYLDLHRYREVSNAVATKLQVHHESPQLLLIRDGECILDSSHLAITFAEVEEVLQVPS